MEDMAIMGHAQIEQPLRLMTMNHRLYGQFTLEVFMHGETGITSTLCLAPALGLCNLSYM